MLSQIKSYTTSLLTPITAVLAKAGLKPNHLTFLGLFFGFAAALLICQGMAVFGAMAVLLSGLMDMLDGALARNAGKTTPFGGFLDSVFDRYVDVAIFIALGVYGADWLIVSIALSGALLVSYTRARAEHIIPKCDVGIAERGERLLIIVAGLLTNHIWHAVAIVAVLSHITAIHRVIHTYSVSKS
ncbi:archaetidylinositol phosphate synthase [Archaeoglobus veneficus]|uniref:Archaetidylinositol phosphate synthase n=1 Tax=Archaeoglobus veneficus (strain DSM 11195 / SNP6) TaxID=693661 RepID=F2KT61_ARCVS|nr:archaetidylinositol phosphate synthase [Archaeoglobus veneficus]AEA47091.1 CDP-alcohol phosphatidyltransferase [Archaeoglobus veneficus SNP6]